MSIDTGSAQSGISVRGNVRAVTDAEVEAFRRDGWVKLEGMLSPDLTAELLSVFQAKLAADTEQKQEFQVFSGTYWRRPSLSSELFRDLALSAEVGQLFKRLIGRTGRYYNDSAITKPARQGPEGFTTWHQDWPSFPIDRTDSLNLWIALDDIVPEQGSMRFLSGSHRSGVWGVEKHDEPSAVDKYPELLEMYEISEPLTYRAGDATVHRDLTLHMAPENRTDRVRYSLVEIMVAADALYTGQQHWPTDEVRDELELFQPLCDERFPVL